MTNKELVLNMLAELSTKEISETSEPETFSEHITRRRGGSQCPVRIGSQNREKRYLTAQRPKDN